MSNASDTSWIVENYSSASANIVWYTGWITLGASVLQLHIEGLFAKSIGKKINTVVNALIGLMILSSSLACVPYNFVALTTGATSVTCLILSSIGNFAFYIAYFHYSWIRGRNVIENVVPSVIPFIPYYFAVFTLLELTTNTLYTAVSLLSATDPAYASLTSWDNNTYTACIALLFVFDLLVMVAYILYMVQLQNTYSNADVGALRIISLFGIASQGVFFLSLFGEVVNSYVAWDYGDPVHCTVALVLTGMDMNVGTIYLFLQLWMKAVLEKEKANSLTKRQTAVDRARSIISRGAGSVFHPVKLATTEGLATGPGFCLALVAAKADSNK
ncbi:hypothetical protein BC830DRAFT_16740 [Chytriomyces sp. MP71]|nr:hypothetical protein BC830DRAFT_16740 [Chytriomyces sp. MP71]